MVIELDRTRFNTSDWLSRFIASDWLATACSILVRSASVSVFATSGTMSDWMLTISSNDSVDDDRDTLREGSSGESKFMIED